MNDISVSYCTQQQLEKLTEFAYLLNNDIEHSSTFCSKSKGAIKEELLGGISRNCVLACWNDDEIVGVFHCYIDKARNNADCNMLIDSRKGDYNAVARLLFEEFRTSNDIHMKYTFFFPKENVECVSFLDSIHASRQVNEYHLILKKKKHNSKVLTMNITELPTDCYLSFMGLHDSIFPGVYVSGADVIKDIRKNRFVYSLIESGILIAYSVLRLNRDGSATLVILIELKGKTTPVINHL